MYNERGTSTTTVTALRSVFSSGTLLLLALAATTSVVQRADGATTFTTDSSTNGSTSTTDFSTDDSNFPTDDLTDDLTFTPVIYTDDSTFTTESSANASTSTTDLWTDDSTFPRDVFTDDSTFIPVIYTDDSTFTTDFSTDDFTYVCPTVVQACTADETCANCISTAVDSGEEITDCRIELGHDEIESSTVTCSDNMGIACCLDKVADEDCLANDEFADFFLCLLATVGCTDDEITCSGASSMFGAVSKVVAFSCASAILLPLLL
eukprot:jgi/Undpi1/7708/HiC_scaffold_23.g10181.m1